MMACASAREANWCTFKPSLRMRPLNLKTTIDVSGRHSSWRLLGAYVAWSSPDFYDTRKTNQPVPSEWLSSYSPETSPDTWKPIPGVGQAADYFLVEASTTCVF